MYVFRAPKTAVGVVILMVPLPTQHTVAGQLRRNFAQLAEMKSSSLLTLDKSLQVKVHRMRRDMRAHQATMIKAMKPGIRTQEPEVGHGTLVKRHGRVNKQLQAAARSSQ